MNTRYVNSSMFLVKKGNFFFQVFVSARPICPGEVCRCCGTGSSQSCSVAGMMWDGIGDTSWDRSC